MARAADTTLRPYVAGDLVTCLDVFDTNVPEFFRRHERQGFEVFLGSLPGPYYVLSEPSGHAVACGGYAVEGEVADLCWGMVRRDLHGHGLGRKLTELRLREIRADQRARRVRLHTSQHTVAFYERLGFRETRVVHDGYSKDLHRHDMMLELGDA